MPRTITPALPRSNSLGLCKRRRQMSNKTTRPQLRFPSIRQCMVRKNLLIINNMLIVSHCKFPGAVSGRRLHSPLWRLLLEFMDCSNYGNSLQDTGYYMLIGYVYVSHTLMTLLLVKRIPCHTENLEDIVVFCFNP